MRSGCRKEAGELVAGILVSGMLRASRTQCRGSKVNNSHHSNHRLLSSLQDVLLPMVAETHHT